MEVIEARHYDRDAARTCADLIVIHAAETSCRPGSARAIARWWAGPSSPRTSAHYVVGPGEVVRCVPPDRVAWHAPGANAVGVGIELTAFAAWGREQWLEERSFLMLQQAAAVVALETRRFSIPVAALSVEDLARHYWHNRRGADLDADRPRGIVTHAQVTAAFPGLGSGHTDPGEHFPMGAFLRLVQASALLERWRSITP